MWLLIFIYGFYIEIYGDDGWERGYKIRLEEVRSLGI